MDDEPKLVAVLGELARAFDRRAFLDVLQNLRITRLVADDQQAAARLLHGLERLVISGDARSAGPRQAQRFQLGAEFDGARLLDIEGVVVEKEFLYVRPVRLNLSHLCGNVVRRPLTPRVSTQGLRPQAEGALRRAAAS